MPAFFSGLSAYTEGCWHRAAELELTIAGWTEFADRQQYLRYGLGNSVRFHSRALHWQWLLEWRLEQVVCVVCERLVLPPHCSVCGVRLLTCVAEGWRRHFARGGKVDWASFHSFEV